MSMSADTYVDMDGVPDMLAQLAAAGQNQRSSLAAGGQYIKSQMAVYPPPRRQQMRFKSAHHRRGFFAKLRSGEIDVPYRRGISPGSRKLGQSWSVVANEREAIVGTRVSYGPLVQAREFQAGYHQGNWRTEGEVVERYGARAAEIVKETALAGL